MTREEVIRDIHALNGELAALEEQYGLLSADFYHCYRAPNWRQLSRTIRKASRIGKMRSTFNVPSSGDAPLVP